MIKLQPTQGRPLTRRNYITEAACGLSLFVAIALSAEPSAPVLPGTQPLTMEGDLAAQIVGGIDTYLDRLLADAPKSRARYWNRDLSSPEAYVKSVETNRQHLAAIMGVVDKREPVQLEFSAPFATDMKGNPAEIGRGKGFKIYAVTWNVFRGVRAEGLLLVPDGDVRASVVAIPDCDWTPEQIAGLQAGLPAASQFARRLAEAGCRVIVPFLVDRSDTYSGLPGVRKLRQSQREVLWRAAYEMGRTIQGYEVQKVLAAVDWLEAQPKAAQQTGRIGVVGYGEGGLIACFAGALDPRIDLVVVSGYEVNPNLHEEPIYRNVWSLTAEFGAGEIAGLIAPRQLLWEDGKYPEAEYPKPGQPNDGGAPGKLRRPTAETSQRVLDEATAWLEDVPGTDHWKVIRGQPEDVINDETLSAISDDLDLSTSAPAPAAPVTAVNPAPDNNARLLRQYLQILEDTQWLMREAEYTRAAFWSKADRKSAASFAESAKWYRDYFLNEIVGPIPPASLRPNPRSRKVSETDAFTGYEVVLDVHPDVFAYGILLVPKGIKPGEKRPVVICQHGLEGRPSDVADPKVDSPYYHAFACRLAEQGFITFAPQNCYIGGNHFRQVLRKAQPLKLTLWSFIMRQQEVILDWLATRDDVDPTRMAFYGLSYGGKTAMRIPQLLDRYCLSICSGDYNEWIWKNVCIRSGYCYLYWGEYDMPEFNLGNTFNYAELSWLMIPRPFMVERGHDDGVAPDEWVAYEFAKTRRQYDKLGLADQTELEFFNGPHTIHGKGTFEFLHKHLNWPERK
jgi:dienelactone hydrolase